MSTHIRPDFWQELVDGIADGSIKLVGHWHKPKGDRGAADIRAFVYRPGPKPRCAHCGFGLRGYATVGEQRVCHPEPGPWPDCYQLVTVWGEPLGARIPRTHDEETTS